MKITVTHDGKTSIIAFQNSVELARLTKQLKDLMDSGCNFPAAHTIFANEITPEQKRDGQQIAQEIVNSMARPQITPGDPR